MITPKRPEETKQDLDLLSQRQDIFDKIDFYKSVLRALEQTTNAIEAKITKGFTLEKYSFIGLPITKKVPLDEYAIGKLNLEKHHLLAEMNTKKQYFEIVLKRKQDYDTKFAEVTKDCNENYDRVIAEAQELRMQIISLKMFMDNYSNPDNDQVLKNEYFLFCKFEVERYKLKKASGK